MKKFKRFVVFQGPVFYPGGGIKDFFGTFNTIEEMQKAIDEFYVNEDLRYEWFNGLDLPAGVMFEYDTSTKAFKLYDIDSFLKEHLMEDHS